MRLLDSNYFIAEQVEVGGLPHARLLLKDVYAVYAGRFWHWFGITAPASLVASVVFVTADRRIRAIYGSIPRKEIPYHFAAIAEAGVLRFGSFFISWLLGCFALAAIATVANDLQRDDNDGVWKSDSFQRAREHFGALVLVAVFTFFAFLAGAAVVAFVGFALFWRLGWAHLSSFSYWGPFVGTLIVGGIVSWFGMAIPLILRGDIGPWASLKKSVKISNGYEGFLFFLLLESTVGSYLAWYAAHYGLTFLLPLQLRSTEWYGWLVYFATILASAAVQPPMFIGYSLLASRKSSTEDHSDALS